MKSIIKYSLVAMSLLVALPSLSCEICGCGVNSSSLGVSPQFQKNLFGLNYQYNSFNHPFSDLSLSGNSRVLSDYYHSMGATVRWYPKPKIQMVVNLPFAVNKRKEETRTTSIQSIGDIEVRFGYMFFNTTDSMNRKMRHMFLAGTGIQMPTGKYQQRNPQKTMYPSNFQIGSGSWANRLYAFYTIRKGNWGYNAQLNYLTYAENELKYRRGTLFSATLYSYYWIQRNAFSFLPNAALSYENISPDQSYGLNKSNTGGQFYNVNIGLESFYKRHLLSLTFQQPIKQNLNRFQPTKNTQFGLGISTFF